MKPSFGAGSDPISRTAEIRCIPGLLVGLFFVSVAACTPTHFHAEPYRSDPAAAAAVVQRAQSWCAERRGKDDLPPYPFTSDGCSASPDGDWAECCVDHDIAYWCGGTREDRRRADHALADCIVSRDHSRCLAGAVRAGVLLGGAPWEPFPWRWGYGWKGPRAYDRAP